MKHFSFLSPPFLLKLALGAALAAAIIAVPLLLLSSSSDRAALVSALEESSAREAALRAQYTEDLTALGLQQQQYKDDLSALSAQYHAAQQATSRALARSREADTRLEMLTQEADAAANAIPADSTTAALRLAYLNPMQTTPTCLSAPAAGWVHLQLSRSDAADAVISSCRLALSASQKEASIAADALTAHTLLLAAAQEETSIWQQTSDSYRAERDAATLAASRLQKSYKRQRLRKNLALGSVSLGLAAVLISSVAGGP